MYFHFQPDVQPGKCWAMDGTHGYITIQLAMPIMVSAVSLEHIPKDIAPSGRLDSAPRDFLIIVSKPFSKTMLDDTSNSKTMHCLVLVSMTSEHVNYFILST